ncbi:hypothetical protein [Catenovulum maritimum]|uniref:hypothetical protein n=1 Tax=Catenovulum maritimum TaxID=1513271 RepID=UPI0012B6008A|nr:hypothetical protein [Catenovulum maritimum]
MLENKTILGKAVVADVDSGEVLFNIKSAADYGEFTAQKNTPLCAKGCIRGQEK